MNVISYATDKFVSNRLDGMDRNLAFCLASLETHRYLMDFVYYAGEPLGEKMYNDMKFVLDDIRFTQTAEFQYECKIKKIKSPA